MENRVLIISVKKNEIQYVKRTKKLNLAVPTFLMFIVTIVLLGIFGSSEVKSVTTAMTNIYNPVNSLYNDSSTTIFTSGHVSKESLDFVIPIKGADKVNNLDGTLEFRVAKSIMVYACSDGLIDQTGTTIDGRKFIKIRHAENIYSIVENIDIIGVGKGAIVKKGQDIAIAEVGEVIRFELYHNEIKVTNLKINHSKIVWQD